MKYATAGLPHPVFVSKYMTNLPSEQELQNVIEMEREKTERKKTEGGKRSGKNGAGKKYFGEREIVTGGRV